MSEIDGEFEAQLFDETLPSGRVSGIALCTAQGIEFRGPQQTQVYPYVGMRIRTGGTNHRLIFIEHDDQPARTVATADRDLFKHEDIQRHSELEEQVKKLTRANQGRWGLLVAIVVLCVGLVFGAWGLKSYAVSAVVARIDPVHEIELGDQLFSSVASSFDLIDDEESIRLLKTMAQPLLQAAGTTYPLRIYISRDPSINAFAMPGGHIVFNSGLIAEATTGEQILGVLAHEIIHVTQRHTLKSLVDRLGTAILLQVFFADAGAIGELIGGSAPKLLESSYSRQQESEADALGFELLIQANIDPRGLAEFFDLLEHEHGDAQPPEFLSTHPATESRRDAMRARIAQLKPDQKNFRTLDDTFLQLKKRLQ